MPDGKLPEKINFAIEKHREELVSEHAFHTKAINRLADDIRNALDLVFLSGERIKRIDIEMALRPLFDKVNLPLHIENDIIGRIHDEWIDHILARYAPSAFPVAEPLPTESQPEGLFPELPPLPSEPITVSFAVKEEAPLPEQPQAEESCPPPPDEDEEEEIALSHEDLQTLIVEEKDSIEDATPQDDLFPFETSGPAQPPSDQDISDILDVVEGAVRKKKGRKQPKGGDNGKAIALFDEAFRLSKGKDREGAIAKFQEVISMAKDPYNLALAHHGIANLYWKTGSGLENAMDQIEAQEHFKKALEFYRAVVAEDPPRGKEILAGAHANMSSICKTLGQKNQAIEYGQKAVELDPGNKEALKLFHRIGGLLPKERHARKIRCTLYIVLCIALLGVAEWRAKMVSGTINDVRGKMHLRAKYSEGEKKLSGLVTQMNEGVKKNWKAMEYEPIANELKKLLDEGFVIPENIPDATLAYATALTNAEKEDQAILALQEISKKNKQAENDLHDIAQRLLDKGQKAYMTKKYAEAIPSLTKALPLVSENKDKAAIHYGLAWSYRYTGKPEEALKEFNLYLALEKEPDAAKADPTVSGRIEDSKKEREKIQKELQPPRETRCGGYRPTKRDIKKPLLKGKPFDRSKQKKYR